MRCARALGWSTEDEARVPRQKKQSRKATAQAASESTPTAPPSTPDQPNRPQLDLSPAVEQTRLRPPIFAMNTPFASVVFFLTHNPHPYFKQHEDLEEQVAYAYAPCSLQDHPYETTEFRDLRTEQTPNAPTEEVGPPPVLPDHFTYPDAVCYFINNPTPRFLHDPHDKRVLRDSICNAYSTDSLPGHPDGPYVSGQTHLGRPVDFSDSDDDAPLLDGFSDSEEKLRNAREENQQLKKLIEDTREDLSVVKSNLQLSEEKVVELQEENTEHERRSLSSYQSKTQLQNQKDEMAFEHGVEHQACMSELEFQKGQIALKEQQLAIHQKQIDALKLLNKKKVVGLPSGQQPSRATSYFRGKQIAFCQACGSASTKCTCNAAVVD